MWGDVSLRHTGLGQLPALSKQRLRILSLWEAHLHARGHPVSLRETAHIRFWAFGRSRLWLFLIPEDFHNLSLRALHSRILQQLHRTLIHRVWLLLCTLINPNYGQNRGLIGGLGRKSLNFFQIGVIHLAPLVPLHQCLEIVFLRSDYLIGILLRSGHIIVSLSILFDLMPIEGNVLHLVKGLLLHFTNVSSSHSWLSLIIAVRPLHRVVRAQVFSLQRTLFSTILNIHVRMQRLLQLRSDARGKVAL